MPRYLSSIGKEASDGPQAILKFQILKELFLAGSLSQTEIANTIQKRQTNSKIFKSLADGKDLRDLVATTCAKLTQDNILVGVSNEQNQTVRQPTKKEAEALRKRDAKKDRKDEEKMNKVVKREEAEVADLDDKIILKINFSRFLAEERRDAVIALAKKKF